MSRNVGTRRGRVNQGRLFVLLSRYPTGSAALPGGLHCGDYAVSAVSYGYRGELRKETISGICKMTRDIGGL